MHGANSQLHLREGVFERLQNALFNMFVLWEGGENDNIKKGWGEEGLDGV